jgi:hypothetical protein
MRTGSDEIYWCEVRNNVFEAMRIAAFENGYDMWTQDPKVQALNLVQCDVSLEDVEPEKLVPFIEEWRKLNPKPTGDRLKGRVLTDPSISKAKPYKA